MRNKLKQTLLDMHYSPTTRTWKIMNGPELLFPTTITVNIDSPPRTHVYRAWVMVVSTANFSLAS